MNNHLNYIFATLGTFTLAFSALPSQSVQAEGEEEALITLESRSPQTTPSQTDFSSGVERAIHSVVTIRTNATPDMARVQFDGSKGPQPYEGSRREHFSGSGSGVIISQDGYIVTNHHVINGSAEISVELNDGSTFSAELLGSDSGSDIALLKINAEDLKPAQFASSEELQLGESVAAIGNPFDVGISVSTGVVSALGRHGMELTDDDYFIQTDAALNPGNSGGALINFEGRVVGINTAIRSQTGSYAGIGFAVPSTTVEAICQQILDHGDVRRGQLGVTLDPDSAREAGVKLESVSEGSAAATAGLTVW